MDTKILLKILDISIKRNGAEKPLTLGHLRNIIGVVNQYEETAQLALEEEQICLDKFGAECSRPNQ